MNHRLKAGVSEEEAKKTFRFYSKINCWGSIETVAEVLEVCFIGLAVVKIFTNIFLSIVNW